MTGTGSKVIALVLVAVVVAGGFGYWLLAPKMPSENMTYTTQQTSSLLSSVQTSQSSISSTVVTSSSETTLWINVNGTKPVSYYLGLLESNGIQPYVQLARELRKIPDVSNATAVAKIAYLALNATNPEVKEAFQLMMRGGTPDTRDFTYTVPSWNTELQVLYWLALHNAFKQDDTLALSIAMVNGLWVTIGDNQVTEAVKKDTSDLLAFFRETNELQKQRGYYQLEGYPLEAKVVLAWTGGQSVDVAKEYAASLYLRERYPLDAYNWCVTNLHTLRGMRDLMVNKGWWEKESGKTVKNIADYFWYDGSHWTYSLSKDRSKTVVANDVQMSNWMYGSTNYVFQQYSQNGVIEGVSYDFLPFIDSWLKSVGIASSDVWVMYPEKPRTHNFYDFNIIYSPESGIWTAYSRQIDDWLNSRDPDELVELKLFKPPTEIPGYLAGIEAQRQHDETLSVKGVNFSSSLYVDNRAYADMLGTSQTNGAPFVFLRDAVSRGIASDEMKKYILS
jgi:hypothetical protein